MAYRRRKINLDKLSSYVRRTGICTEEAALHLMDEIMFLRAEIIAAQSDLDGLRGVFNVKCGMVKQRDETILSLVTDMAKAIAYIRNDDSYGARKLLYDSVTTVNI